MSPSKDYHLEVRPILKNMVELYGLFCCPVYDVKGDVVEVAGWEWINQDAKNLYYFLNSRLEELYGRKIGGA